MLDLTGLVTQLRNEVLEYGPMRKKLSVIMWDWLGQRQKKSAAIMRQFDQLLLENGLAVYTRRANVRHQLPNWEWADLRNNEVFITFIRASTATSMSSNQNILKRQVVNEPWPTEGLFTLYASQASEILICSAYVDEVMTDLLVDIAQRYNIRVRFVADIGYSGNPYKRPIIRAKLETIGTFRTLAGTDDETGIMHLKLYVFYQANGSVSVFNTSANFTANAWKFVNHEAPVTIQTASMQDPQISILVNAAERMWQKSEGTPPPAFQQNDRVTHATFGTGVVLQITGPNVGVLFGGTNFQIVPASDVQFLIDPLERLASGNFTLRDTVQRTKAKFLAHYINAQNTLTNEFYDFRIKPVPHQLLALKRAVTSRNGGNLLLADDVGLGKTIEAGLIIQNLVNRRGEDKARVLVMCPAGLKYQWFEELRDKFGLNFNIWKVDTVGGAEAFSGGFHGNNRMIASYHGMTVGEMEAAILRAIVKYDLVIIDECHRFANEATQWWQLARDMREQNKVGQLLLLSATPHSGDQSRFLNLLHLLDAETFAKGHRTQESMVKLDDNQLITEYVYRNDKLSVTDFDKTPLFRNVSTQSVSVELTPDEQGFCKLVEDYIYALNDAKAAASPDMRTQIGFVMSMYRKMLASSWKNVFRSMQARYRYLLQQASEENDMDIPLFDNDEETDEREERKIDKLIKEMKSKRLFSNELALLQQIDATGREPTRQNIDTKVQRLLTLVNHPDNAGQKFIIFTQFVKTLEVIKQALGAEYVAEIQGSINIDGRRDQVDKFENRVRFMICTEAGGEGINLQFANNVVNFDMPWNPARLQQRIGRVWRYGQKQDVQCYNFFVTNTISDQRVLQKLNERINITVRNFLVPLEFNGVHEDLHEALIYDVTMRVLGEAQRDESFESIMGILDKTLREQRLAAAEERILEALHFVQQDQKDLAPSINQQLKELDNFYAPRNVNFLLLFAKSVATSFGGQLYAHANGVYEFFDLNLQEAGIPDTLYKNYLFTFEQGTSGKTDEGVEVNFFGFGNDFFNQVIEYCRNQTFGGTAAMATVASPGFSAPVILITATANSIATGSDASENYPLCAFVSAQTGAEVYPEMLFSADWYEASMTTPQTQIAAPIEHFANTLDSRVLKLMSYRNREFVRTEPSIESALGVTDSSLVITSS